MAIKSPPSGSAGLLLQRHPWHEAALFAALQMGRLKLLGVIQGHVGEPKPECRLAATHLAVDRKRIVKVFEKRFAHALSP